MKIDGDNTGFVAGINTGDVDFKKIKGSRQPLLSVSLNCLAV